MPVSFNPDSYFHTGEWKDAVDPSRNHYERLGLKFGDNYSAADCKESFQLRYNWWREVNKRYSTNTANTKTKDTGPASREAMERLHTAYTTLSDPVKKASYDKLLKDERDKKCIKEFLKMINIVLSDGVLSQEGERILINCADTLGISRANALNIISSEMRRTGATYKAESPDIKGGETFTDYYKILEVNPTASSDEIENAYKKRYFIWENLSKNYKFKNEAEQKKKQLQDAVNTLLDQKRRKIYDQRLKELFAAPVRIRSQRKNIYIITASGLGLLFVAISVVLIIMRSSQPKISKPSSVISQHNDQGKKDISVIKKASSSGWMGVGIQDMTPELAEAFNVTVTEGAVVCEIEENSPAKESGLEYGDIIVEYDGKPVKHGNHLLYIVTRTETGSTIKIKMLRNSEEKELYVKICEQPPYKPVHDPATIPYENDIGLTVQNITKDIARKTGIKEMSGVIVSDVHSGSRAARSGIRKGDIINEVGREEVKNVAGLRLTFSKLDMNKAMRIHIKREAIYFYMIIGE